MFFITFKLKSEIKNKYTFVNLKNREKLYFRKQPFNLFESSTYEQTTDLKEKGVYGKYFKDNCGKMLYSLITYNKLVN